jgi:hypothetical protein
VSKGYFAIIELLENNGIILYKCSVLSKDSGFEEGECGLAAARHKSSRRGELLTAEPPPRTTLPGVGYPLVIVFTVVFLCARAICMIESAHASV